MAANNTTNPLAQQVLKIYLTAVLIIAALITGGQLIIQTTLFQEIDTRNLAFTMSRQTLRSQRLLRNAILVYAGPDDKPFNPLNLNAPQLLQADLNAVETTNKQLLSKQMPSEVSDAIDKLQEDFQQSDSAAHTLLADAKHFYGEKKPITDRALAKKMTDELSTIFIHDQNYFVGLYNIYYTISQQADSKVSQVQMTEIIIYLVSIAVLIYEIFFVVMPTIRGYSKTLKELAALEHPVEGNIQPA